MNVSSRTVVFYIFVASLLVLPCWFIWQYWDKAKKRELRWLNQDNRNMYVDALKTMITASGIAVALVASSAVASARNKNPIVEFSARIAVVCLVSCVCLSLTTIMALLRGYELAQARLLAQAKSVGVELSVKTQGSLSDSELGCILVPAVFSFSCFLVGFVFLARIAFHF
jgi:hypothetical protein